jgi:NDP-sugar pyrophosphorylase family protein
MKRLNVFILAAGFGERLRPITNQIPKPLLPILGRPVIDIILGKVTTVAFNHIGINMHYKWEMIQDWARTTHYSEKIKLFYEDAVLGTGGALKNAESFLRDSIFLVHNSDILSDIELNTLIEQHNSSGNSATLAVHNLDSCNNVWIDNNGLLKSVGESSAETHNGLRRVAFTGIAVYSPSFLDFLPNGRSSVVDAWLTASNAGVKIGTINFTGCQWSDIGSPEAYSTAIFQTLKKEGENVYVHPSVAGSDIFIKSYAVIEEGCIIEGNSSLRNCVVLPGSRVKKDSKLENSIVGPDYFVGVNEPLSIPPSLSSHLVAEYLNNDLSKLQISLIGTGGSDRKYYRIQDEEKSAVIMECSPSDPDYKRQLLYTQFFRKYSVPVPELLGRDTGDIGLPFVKQGLINALFEDLGDMSLYSALKFKNNKEKAEGIYRRVLDILVLLHTTVTGHVSECPLLQSRVFDYDHLKWETSYFIERFVCGLLGVEVKEPDITDKEFSQLAKQVDSFRKTIIHRDFQSQNIMLTKGDVPRIIDFQGARIGPPAYDLVSILWDPYFRLESAMRERLLDYYMGKTKEFDSNFDEAEFIRTILPCRLQRHMQALGAYGFLSKVKGKRYFLKHIPQAFHYLHEEAELAKTEYPHLHELMRKMQTLL